jgi:hypothetical protein
MQPRSLFATENIRDCTEKNISTASIPQKGLLAQAAELCYNGRMKTERWKTLAIALIFLFACLALGVYSVSHKWEYHNAGGALLRTDRFSGRTEVLRDSGWAQMSAH